MLVVYSNDQGNRILDYGYGAPIFVTVPFNPTTTGANTVPKRCGFIDSTSYMIDVKSCTLTGTVGTSNVQCQCPKAGIVFATDQTVTISEAPAYNSEFFKFSNFLYASIFFMGLLLLV